MSPWIVGGTVACLVAMPQTALLLALLGLVLLCADHAAARQS